MRCFTLASRALACLVAFSASPALALDVIRLKSGKELRGKVVTETPGRVVFEYRIGSMKAQVTYKRAEIAEIRRNVKPDPKIDKPVKKPKPDPKTDPGAKTEPSPGKPKGEGEPTEKEKKPPGRPVGPVAPAPPAGTIYYYPTLAIEVHIASDVKLDGQAMKPSVRELEQFAAKLCSLCSSSYTSGSSPSFKEARFWRDKPREWAPFFRLVLARSGEIRLGKELRRVQLREPRSGSKDWWVLAGSSKRITVSAALDQSADFGKTWHRRFKVDVLEDAYPAAGVPVQRAVGPPTAKPRLTPEKARMSAEMRSKRMSREAVSKLRSAIYAKMFGVAVGASSRRQEEKRQAYEYPVTIQNKSPWHLTAVRLTCVETRQTRGAAQPKGVTDCFAGSVAPGKSGTFTGKATAVAIVSSRLRIPYTLSIVRKPVIYEAGFKWVPTGVPGVAADKEKDILAALKGEDAAKRKDAIERVVALRERGTFAIPALVDLLGRVKGGEDFLAQRVLAHHGEKSLKYLIAAASSPDPVRREAVISTLGRMRGSAKLLERIVPVFEKASKDSNARVSDAGKRCFADFTRVIAFQLSRVLEQGKPTERREAVEKLGKLNAPRSVLRGTVVKALQKALKDKDWATRQKAEVQFFAVWGRIIDELAVGLGSKHASVRKQSLGFLGALPAPERLVRTKILPAIGRMRSDKNAEVAAEAKLQLGNVNKKLAEGQYRLKR